jgi:hypothetical protein
MSNFNINAGYGKVTMAVPFQPIGKIFAVGDSSTANIDILKQIMIPDAAGTVRFCATLVAAMDLATADAGDVIYLMPGHIEAVIATGVVLLNKAGVSVIGLGNGTLMPTFNISKTDAKCQITARDTLLRNVRIQPISTGSGGSSSCVIGIQLLSSEACKNIQIDSCVFGPRSSQCAAFDSIIDITTGTDSTGSNFFDGLKITNNVFQYFTSSVTGRGFGINLKADALSWVEISGNRGATYSSAGTIVSSGSGYGWIIENNKLHNQSTGLVINITGTALYGQINNNLLSTLSTGAKGAVFDSGAMAVNETYVCPAQNADRCGAIPYAAIT